MDIHAHAHNSLPQLKRPCLPMRATLYPAHYLPMPAAQFPYMHAPAYPDRHVYEHEPARMSTPSCVYLYTPTRMPTNLHAHPCGPTCIFIAVRTNLPAHACTQAHTCPANIHATTAHSCPHAVFGPLWRGWQRTRAIRTWMYQESTSQSDAGTRLLDCIGSHAATVDVGEWLQHAISCPGTTKLMVKQE